MFLIPVLIVLYRKNVLYMSIRVCLLLDGAGICDPCEKELTDAIGHMDSQQREDITQSAQV